MFDHNHYVPVLKWRQGEYLALSRLDPAVRDWVTPLFEVPTEAWDFEAEAPAKSLDEHLAKFGVRLKQKWDSRRCFVDSPFIDGEASVDNGTHHLAHIFDLARVAGAMPVPVLGLGRSEAYIGAVRAIVDRDGRGACLRLTPDDFGVSMHAEVDALLKGIGIDEGACDLVLDCAADIATSPKMQALVWKGLLDELPKVADWRSITIAGTSFPQTLPSALFRPSGVIKRHDWLGYKSLVGMLPAGVRVPTFGDYGVAHPETELIDPRMLDPNAKVKYTINDEWFIAMGVQVKKHGRAQYADVCRSIVSARPPIFMGGAYSYGDKFIEDCANGDGSTGGASTWPMVGSNHHVTKVVRDVATLFGASALP
ncbi:beta family protein [Burkholderia pyrrocinia]|uniref:beta family protein n=1 Tax=Burkholderia pyrrocinia TaxID=60550 RepID=UPI001FB4DDD3|nr:beta family protein [Burkholderia pyrrocinia]UOB55528.1 beta family protein [Burkholderia pyrrocinia]